MPEFKTFKTSNLRLKNFLALHKIVFKTEIPEEDGSHSWIFDRTQRFESVFDEYKSIWVDNGGRASA